MVSYYYENELEAAKQVSDKDLNELLQEVREISPNLYLQEHKRTIKKWFKKPQEQTSYTLLNHVGGLECQIINFAQEHDWSINGTVAKSYIYTYFYGFLGGYKRINDKKTP